MENHTVTLTIGYAHLTIINTNRFHNKSNDSVDHNEDIDKEIRISLSIFWDIAIQGGNEVMRYLSNSFIYGYIKFTKDNIFCIFMMIQGHKWKNTSQQTNF